MTDREMLELAATAAGYVELEYANTEVGFFLLDPVDGKYNIWNPLVDDGDALRLAVKLRIDHEYEGETVTVWFMAPRPGRDNGQVWSWTEPLDDDPCAAVRLAIVLAAVEIGQKMKEKR